MSHFGNVFSKPNIAISGNVTCSAYPLAYLDTINSLTGELNTNSALNLIVFGPKIAHLDLIEYVVVDLLKVKWDSFVKKEFFTQLYTFVVYFFLAAACFILRPTLPAEEEEECSGEEGLGSDGANSSLSEDDTATPTVDYTMLLTTLEAMDFGVSPSPIRWFGIGKEGVGRGASKLAFDWSKSDESEAS